VNGWGGTNFKKSSVTPCRWTDVLIKRKRNQRHLQKCDWSNSHFHARSSSHSSFFQSRLIHTRLYTTICYFNFSSIFSFFFLYVYIVDENSTVICWSMINS
jgi:hypothetical protein